jgi:hypothetical protein
LVVTFAFFPDADIFGLSHRSAGKTTTTTIAARLNFSWFMAVQKIAGFNLFTLLIM